MHVFKSTATPKMKTEMFNNTLPAVTTPTVTDDEMTNDDEVWFKISRRVRTGGIGHVIRDLSRG